MDEGHVYIDPGNHELSVLSKRFRVGVLCFGFRSWGLGFRVSLHHWNQTTGHRTTYGLVTPIGPLRKLCKRI